MKKNVLAMAIVVLIAAAGCKKGNQTLSKDPGTPTLRLIGGGGYEFGTFTPSEECLNTGDENICCPPPPAECCKSPVDVSASSYEIGLAPVDGNNPIEVAEFFLNGDWQQFFPQLVAEEELLQDLRNGLYTLTKTVIGNKVYCTFQSDNDKLTLIVTLI